MDYTKNLSNALMKQAVSPVQAATPLTGISKLLTAIMAQKANMGAHKAEDTRNKLDMSSIQSAYRGDTPYAMSEGEYFDNPSEVQNSDFIGMPVNNKERGTGQNVDAMAQAMMGSHNPEYQKLGLAQVMAQPKKPPNYTINNVRYSGETNQPLVTAPADPSKQNEIDFKNSAKLREKFESQTKDFVKVRDAYGRIVASAQEPSAAGDMALIFNYMKVLDPGSTVREGEFATAQNAGGVNDRIRSAYNSVIDGTRLTPAQRYDFVGRGKNLYESQLKGLEKLESEYKELSEMFEIDPNKVVVDYRVEFPDLPVGFEPEEVKEIKGKTYMLFNGDWYAKD